MLAADKNGNDCWLLERGMCNLLPPNSGFCSHDVGAKDQIRKRYIAPVILPQSLRCLDLYMA